jgi:hypothetical protein
MRQSVWRSILFGFITGILFSGCATLTPETASIMTPHELCLKYTGRNKHNARIAYAELSRQGIECDVAGYQQLNRQKNADFQRNIERLQNSINCLEGNYLCK